MPQIFKQFAGIMDLDDSDEVIPPHFHKIARNVKFRGNGVNTRAENIVGTNEIAFNRPTGNNQCIGGYYDGLKQRIFFFNYNSNGNHGIYKYDINTDTVSSLLVCGVNSTGDILNFDLDYPIASVNILYTTDEDGDILSWIQRNDEAKELNIKEAEDNIYGSNWVADYLTVIKAPPQMPIKCVYENDTDVTVNNLRNSLFQFSYRFVYANNEKSVWSAKSIVPLPFQPSEKLTEDTYTNNARISLSFNTGNPSVKKIEISFRQTQNGATTDWFLIQSLNKSELSITDNSIYTYNFYNDGLYNSIDPLETAQLQDYIQRNPNAQELLNGNVKVFAGGTEGYNKINSDLSVDTQAFSISPFYYDYNGTLFFAVIDGIDSGSQGTIIKIYLFGTGTNTAGIVTTLNNGAAKYTINIIDSSYNSIGTSYTNSSDNPTVSDILNNISTNLQGNGFTEVSLVGNILTMSYPATVTLLSSGTQTTGVGSSSPTNAATTHFTYPWQSAYAYSVQYFSNKGRTNGAVNSVGFTLPVDNGGNMTPQLIINHRPPIWASYYQVLRTLNNTYNYRLDWVTNGAYSDAVANILGVRYAYLEIDNIYQYNNELKATNGVVGYTFAQGDRVRIFGRYDANGTPAVINSTYDYEVLSIETNIIFEGVRRFGTFLKIYYPTSDIDSNFKFDGSANFLAYDILIYNYTKHISTDKETYFEFGKCFGIGNSGTPNAYHIGLEQTQSVNLSSPAKITVANGDFFGRKRTIPIGQIYPLSSPQYTQSGPSAYSTPNISISSTITEASLYEIKSSVHTGAGLGLGDYPSTIDTDATYHNLSSSNQLIRVKGILNSSVFDTNGGNLQMYAKVCPTVGNPAITNITPLSTSLQTTQNYEYPFDIVISVPAGAKFWFVIFCYQTQFISISELTLQYVSNVTINIIESSFSDVYKLETNSNGRPSIIDENAKEVYNGALVRWSLPYIQNTNVNGSNTFRFENFDEVDRKRGDIQRLRVRDKILRVFQKTGVGRYGIFAKYIRNNSNQSELVVTDQILTKDNIQYYVGEFGMGEEYCNLGSSEQADYFIYPITGAVIRVAGDGIDNLSDIYKGQYYLSNKMDVYNKTWLRADGSKAKILGYFDFFEENYVVLLQGGSRSGEVITDDAFSFSENRKGFNTTYDYLNPDFMLCAENTTYSWKEGRMYVHNNQNKYGFIWGTQYYPSIQFVFNEQIAVKKNFNAIGYQSNQKWICPEVGDIYTSMVDGQTGLIQQSKLPSWAVEIDENKRIAALLRDVNSMTNPNKALNEGNYLQGFNIAIKFVYLGNDFAWIYLPYLTWEPNNRQF